MGRLQVGSESFREIRENDFCYVDKTGFIEEFLTSSFIKFSLITRPRRFGKTLMMSMLRDFFDITQDSKAIFDGLAISKNKALCDKWMNQYPVIFITLKQIDAENFSHAFGQVTTLVRKLSVLYTYLLESDKVADSDKRILQEFLDSKSSRSELEAFLSTLCSALHAHWGRPAIILIDEYDVPLAKAQEKGYYPEMIDFVRNIMGQGLKTNDFLKFGILTGCLRISKESIFTGLNNFSCFDISEFDFDDKFGFTTQEVDDLLAVAGCPEKKDAIKEWYDGYRFGDNKEIYCPWDILQYLKTLKKNSNAMPQAYWENTSGNTAIRSLIERTGLNVRDKIEKLLDGGHVTSTIITTITYDTLYASEASLWTLLYLSGYLTKAGSEYMAKNHVSSALGEETLIIPNREVRTIFIQNIISWFDDTMKRMDRKPLLDAFWSGDDKTFQDIFTDILMEAISYNDYHENFYHAILTGLFIGAGYAAESNDESGLGRADIIVTGPTLAHAAVIEVKYTRTEKSMPQDAERALRQIKKTKYVTTVKRYKKIMFWGISFCQKSCVAKAEEYHKPQP